MPLIIRGQRRTEPRLRTTLRLVRATTLATVVALVSLISAAPALAQRLPEPADDVGTAPQPATTIVNHDSPPWVFLVVGLGSALLTLALVVIVARLRRPRLQPQPA